MIKQPAMLVDKKIAPAIARTAQVLRSRPSFGQGTGVSKTVVEKGLTCTTTEGNWIFIADMAEQIGGSSKGPTPGVYGRAALGSCLAIGYMMRAAVLGISIEALEVEVQADYDDGAFIGTTTEVPPGYLEVRYMVTVVSTEPEENILRMLEEGDKQSPFLDVFSRAQACKREVRIVKPIQD